MCRYEKSQTIHGLPQPPGLSCCERLSQPIYTPSTKAEFGQKDVNITPAQAREIVGDKYASRIENLVLACYKAGVAYAEECGILIVCPPFACYNFPVILSRSTVPNTPRAAYLQIKACCVANPLIVYSVGRYQVRSWLGRGI